MKRIIILFLLISLLSLAFIFILSHQLSANHLNIEGWDIIENKGKVVLLQKKNQDFLSEAMLNLSVAIGGYFKGLFHQEGR